ncbi:histidine kinase [Flavobacterium sp.]|uniref:histidine kinase n=1 Tax=Flavobacterium sp. TaxID=239 RepID=UPI004034116F
MKGPAAVFFMIVFHLFFLQKAVAQRNTGKISPENMADSLNRLGSGFNKNGDQHKAEANYVKAIALSRKYNLKKQLGYNLYDLSRLYADTENYLTAIEMGEESVGILQKYGDKETVVNSLLNLEKCYRRHGIVIRAMTYADSAVKTLRTFKNDKLLEVALWRQGEIYREWNAELAIPMFNEALALAKKIPEYHNIDNILGSIAHCHTDPYTGRYDPKMAEHYHKLALDASLKYDRTDVNTCRIDYGKICTLNERYKEAEYQLKLVYDDANAADSVDERSIAAFCLSEVYFGMKDYRNAYRYLTEHGSLENKVEAMQKKGTSEKMAFNFKTDRIETQNKLLLQQRELQRVKLEQESFRKNVKIGASVAVALFLLLVTILVYKFFKKKNVLLSKKSDTLRQQVLLTQMSPHFIASSVDSIQALIRNGEADTAAAYLSKFAKLTRQILENSTGQYISLEEEIAMTTNYLAVRQLLHHQGFRFGIECDEDIDAEALYIPPMLTQPLVSHAVDRAVARGGIAWVEVRFFMKNKRLLFEVRDTGAALKPAEYRAAIETGAISITAERLSNGQKGALPVRIKNIEKDGKITGVVAGFEMPYITDD